MSYVSGMDLQRTGQAAPPTELERDQMAKAAVEPRPDDQLEKELVDRRETAIHFADRLRSELREQERIVQATGAALEQLQMDQPQQSVAREF